MDYEEALKKLENEGILVHKITGLKVNVAMPLMLKDQYLCYSEKTGLICTWDDVQKGKYAFMAIF